MANKETERFNKAESEGLTFGLELEMLVRGAGEAVNDNTTTQKMREFGEKLKDHAPDVPIAVACDHVSLDTCGVCIGAEHNMRFLGLRIFTPATPERSENGGSPYLYFFIHQEWLKRPGERLGNYKSYGFEISSPILDMKELKDGLPATSQVVSALRNMELDITAHTECGLHIHVGVGRNMTLLTAQKVITLVMLLEVPLLTKLCPIERHRVTDTWGPITQTSNFIQDALEEVVIDTDPSRGDLDHYFPFTLKDIEPRNWNNADPTIWYNALCQVWKSQRTLELWEGLMSTSDQKNSLYFCHRKEKSMPDGVSGVLDKREVDGSPSTVEFRYPPMSFDITYIKNWAEVACRIMELATYEAKEFRQVVVKLMSILALPPSRTMRPVEWQRLLKELGLEHQIPDWNAQIDLWERGIPINFLGDDGYVLPEEKEDESN